MKIAGLQKTTLIDYPRQIACTVFLKGCNFRCGICYNLDCVLTDKEIIEHEGLNSIEFIDASQELLDYLNHKNRGNGGAV